MSRALKTIQKLNEVNPFRLGRKGVKSATVDTVMRKLQSLKNEIDAVVDEFIPEEDDEKTNMTLKETSKLLGKSVSNLKKVKGK